MFKKSKREIEAKFLPKVTPRLRELHETLTGRAKHAFPHGARGCDLGDGLWLLKLGTDRVFTVALERGGEICAMSQVHPAHKDVVALADEMIVLPSQADIAKAEREQRLAKLGPHEAEKQLRKSWGQDVSDQFIGTGIKLNSESRRRAEDAATRVNGMDDLLTVHGG